MQPNKKLLSSENKNSFISGYIFVHRLLMEYFAEMYTKGQS